MICPFCLSDELDFDLVGLKDHLQSGGCDIFNNTQSIEEEYEHPDQDAIDYVAKWCQHNEN